jgi:hypothetical protein
MSARKAHAELSRSPAALKKSICLLSPVFCTALHLDDVAVGRRSVLFITESTRGETIIPEAVNAHESWFWHNPRASRTRHQAATMASC